MHWSPLPSGDCAHPSMIRPSFSRRRCNCVFGSEVRSPMMPIGMLVDSIVSIISLATLFFSVSKPMMKPAMA